MNVHVLATPAQLPKPDMAIIIASREKLKREADRLGDIYLPVMNEALLSLLSEVGHVDKEALDTLTLVPHMYNSEEMLPFLEAVEKLRGDPEDAKSSAAIADFNEEISLLLDTREASLSSQAKALDRALINLEAVRVDGVEHLTPALEQEIAVLEARLETEHARLTEVVRQAAAVNDLIRDVESLSFFDKLKPLVASLERLADVDPLNPLIGSVKAGIAGVSNILDLLDAAVDYDHLIALRERLQTQMTGLQETTDATRAALETEVSKRGQLSGLASVELCKTDYVREMSKLLEALKRVLASSRLPETAVIEKRVEHFSRQADALNNYLIDLRRSWRS